MTRTKSKVPTKTARLDMVLYLKEREMAVKKAEKLCMTLSEYIRYLIKKDVDK